MVPVSFHLVQGMSEGFPRLVNVMERAHLQSFMSSFIGPCGDVTACNIQKLQCRAHGAIRVSPGRRWSVVGIPSLVAHRISHFMHGALNFLEGTVPRAGKSRSGIRLQQFARLPKVGKGMEIVGTLGLSRRSQGKEQKSRQTEYGCGKLFENTHFSSTFQG
jgi:hypothetical protein